MIYLDYSATTKVDQAVLETFNKTCLNFIGNPNSLHKLGVEAKKLEQKATAQIADLLHVKPEEIIYTSGSTESNNLAIKGICLKYQNRGKRIITTNLEHSSIDESLEALKKQGFIIDIVKTHNGLVNLENLKSLIKDDTILVTIASVNSEIGLRQNIEEIGKILKDYPKCYFHCDMTQSIGKINIDIKNVDLVSFSSHKFYGLKGIGVLVKKDKIALEPQINGGKSTTIYRSGTPPLPLIVSLSKALRLALTNLDTKYDHILKLNNELKQFFNQFKDIHINSNDNCIPHILNISVLNIKPETMQHALEEDDIYISTKSACSDNHSISKAVKELTNDDLISAHSIRISLSHLTSLEEIKKFEEVFAKCYNQLNMKQSN